MGLDGVELVMEIEDHFGITIADDEVPVVRSVGDIVLLVASRLAAARTEPCASVRRFLELRRSVRDVTGQVDLRIKPSHQISHRLTTAERRRLWERLPDLLGTVPAPLQLPRRLRHVLVAIVAGIAVGGSYLAWSVDAALIPLAIAAAGISAISLAWAARPLATNPPPGWRTFGDLTRRLIGKTMATKQLHLHTHDQILAELRPLVAQVLGVGEDKIVWEARLVEDLGLG